MEPTEVTVSGRGIERIPDHDVYVSGRRVEVVIVIDLLDTVYPGPGDSSV